MPKRNHQDTKVTKMHQEMQKQLLTVLVPLGVLGVLVVKDIFP
jgi:hypothetical protein